MPDDETTTPEPDEMADAEGTDEQAAETPDDAESASEDPATIDDDPAAELPADDGAAVEPAPAAESTESATSEEIAAVVGDGAASLAELGPQVAEAFLVGLETVTSHAAQIESVTVTVTDYPVIEAEFATVDHVGLELRVSLSETEALLAGLLIPLDSLSELLKVDASAEQMADADFASAQLETISGSARELLDHLSVTLVPADLAGAEVTLSEARLGQIDFTTGMIADVAQGATPIRLDITLSLPGGEQAPLSLVMPGELLGRIAQSIVGGADEPPAEVAGAAPAAIPEEPANVTPFPAADEPPVTAEAPAFPPIDFGDAPGPGVADDVPVHPVRFPELTEGVLPAAVPRSLDMLMDVSMRVTVELGRSSMTIESVLALGPGSVVELNKLAGEPVDVLINERLIARGEVVVVDENFGVRVTEIVSPRTRANVMGG